MRLFLRSVSVVAAFMLLQSCVHPYKHLQAIQNYESALRYKPKVDRELYRCVVDGKFLLRKFHLKWYFVVQVI